MRHKELGTLNFHTNKKVLKEVSTLPSRHLQSRTTGLTVHLKQGLHRSRILSALPLDRCLAHHQGGASRS